MSPLKVEISRDGSRWIPVGPELTGNHPSASMSNNKDDGSRELIFFECAKDDSKSTIYRSGAGIDMDLGVLRVSEIDVSRLEVIRELLRGESFEMDVRTDRSSEKLRVRFTHK